MAINTKTARLGKQNETRSAAAGRPRLSFGRRVTDRDRKFFTEQMALLLETGTPLQ